MFCNRCGQAIPVGSRFCNVCGTEQSGRPTGEGRYPAFSPTPGSEQPVFELRPTLRFIIAGYLLAGALALACAALIAMAPFRSFWLVLGVAAVLLAVPGWYHLRRETEVYRLTDRKIEIRHGLFNRTVRNIPLTSIQDVTATATLGERLLGIGDIVIESAAETGKIALRNVPQPARYAEAILAQLRGRN